MELSTFATITGILVLLIGLPLLVAGKATVSFLLQLMRNTVCMRVMGAVIVVIAVLTLRQGYRVGTDAAGLLRLIAWVGLIKGVVAAWYPGILTGVSDRFMNTIPMRPVLGVVAIAMGGLLLYGAQMV